MPRGSSRKGIGGWKRGARDGNYTDIQWNIACRISVMGMPNGDAVRTSPSNCPTKAQALISLGYLSYGTCGTKFVRSPCSGVTGPR